MGIRLCLSRWWGRIIRYLETSSLGSDSIEAINLIKMSIDVQVGHISPRVYGAPSSLWLRACTNPQVEELYITVPLHGCFKYEVPTTEVLLCFSVLFFSLLSKLLT